MSTEVFEDYGNGIIAIDTALVRPRMDAVHLLVRNGRAAFIDAGSNLSLPNFLHTLEAQGVEPEQVDYVILTHVHLDHAAGAGSLMRELPNATLVVHPRGRAHMVDPSALVAASRKVYGEERFEALFGELVPVPATRVREVGDGEVLELGGDPLEIIHTPGHALHHVCVVDHATASIFAGDTFGVSYRELDTAKGEFIFPATTPTHFDPAAAHASIDRLLGFDPQAIFITHYSRVTALGRLADDLHRDLDAFVEIARRCRGAEQPVAAIARGVDSYLRERLDAHGCRLPEAELTPILLQDTYLNAQGLAFWLGQQRRDA